MISTTMLEKLKSLNKYVENASPEEIVKLYDQAIMRGIRTGKTSVTEKLTRNMMFKSLGLSEQEIAEVNRVFDGERLDVRELSYVEEIAELIGYDNFLKAEAYYYEEGENKESFIEHIHEHESLFEAFD